MKAPLRTLAELVRAPAALSVPGDVVAGAAAAGTLGARSAGLAAASVCLYWAGMAANDWADRDLDAVERPERPVPSGRVSAPVALGVAAGLTAAGLAVAGRAGGSRALSVALPLAAAVWAYDLRLKNTAAGPAGMAACRALDVLLGASGGNPVRALPAAATIAVHTYVVTVMSRHEVAGCPTPLLPAAALATTTAVAGVTAARGGLPAVLLAGQYAAGFGQAQTVLISDPAPARVRAAVGAGITALPALQGALTARAGRALAGLAVAAAVPVGRLLARRVSPT
ncbi:SCO3242 family prenyltransferase [Couchioplanes caeruleus]|uniref:4-hydroxybenzoate polyprenyltransferase n=1 Tax=Couchioplanes caeruleus TaxID=56438 RepID=A0A3N1GB19_9ACTN|nr:UbiA family prenyltransferase [Couchioplanes caeruleus]ROP27442.1 4-hydroxybenzoate polyprenyltransferase [Couchioplanes caeruleus]